MQESVQEAGVEVVAGADTVDDRLRLTSGTSTSTISVPLAGQRPGGGRDRDGSDPPRQLCGGVVGRLDAGDPPRLGLVGKQHVAAIKHRVDVERAPRIVVGVERRRRAGGAQLVEQAR